MSQIRRQRSARRAEERTAGAEIEPGSKKALYTRLIIGGVVLLVLGLIAYFSFYPTYIAPFKMTVITVDDIAIKMDYFLKTSRLTGSDPFDMIDSLGREQVLRLEAAKLGLTATPEEIDAEIGRVARGDAESISDAELKEWVRQRLNDTGLTNEEYRNVVATSVLATKLQQYLVDRMPTVAEQVHLYSLMVDEEQDAIEARERWVNGEDFYSLVQELSTDDQTRENNGELGWFPSGVLNDQFDYVAFNLTTGNVSDPVPLFTPMDPNSTTQPQIQGWALFYVPERADARQLDEQALKVRRSTLLDNWIGEKLSEHTIKYYGFNGGFDTETYNWIKWQLSKDSDTS